MNKQGRGNIIIFILSLLIFGATIVSSKFLVDTKSPEIIIQNENFKFSCMTKYEDLLNNAYATDENLKEFFIENKDINDIVDSKTVKYVAIDESGNVTKKSLQLNINQDVTYYEISPKKDFIVQLGEEIDFTEYFELRNRCGWKKEGIFNVSGYDLNNESVYEVVVSSSNVKDLTLEMVVVDYKAPVIKLHRSEITIYEDEEFDFKENIDEISDDLDSEEYLLKNLEIEKDDLSRIGEHLITYRVLDSDGNVGTATITLTVKERVKEEVHEERSVEETTYEDETTEYFEEEENSNQDSQDISETSDQQEDNNQEDTAID